mmetsp:Transcript_10226/g.14862  ORF Transcript_10226/g.14862 Transcript_10226/m.14862 type:complete len:231 (-) Transcript_10226:129-821(-)|eukprot:CAMPEP_0175097900 /NCGR_PEP_ID=MMETSP0086_2-20121207/5538_1 /TAXON_ID=136419 /ORGANISM="Unknown Unknown, Strain D1" /LENGTH=230 /DNA_ID=CAMNT_0016371451 /DNA_START=45 /DNA_END=737 /DNA_ORIENTATION=+
MAELGTSKQVPKALLDKLVGRPLVPYFVEDEVNHDHSVHAKDDFSVDEYGGIEVRQFNDDGYFEAPVIVTDSAKKRGGRPPKPAKQADPGKNESKKSTAKRSANGPQKWAGGAFEICPDTEQVPLPKFLGTTEASASVPSANSTARAPAALLNHIKGLDSVKVQSGPVSTGSQYLFLRRSGGVVEKIDLSQPAASNDSSGEKAATSAPALLGSGSSVDLQKMLKTALSLS